MDINVVRAHKDLELLRLNQEVVMRQFPDEPLQEEATFFHEKDFFLTSLLLRWHLRDRDTGESPRKRVLEQEEFIVSTLDFEGSLRVNASRRVDHVPVE